MTTTSAPAPEPEGTSSTPLQIDGKPVLVRLHWDKVDGRLEVVGFEAWTRPPPYGDTHAVEQLTDPQPITTGFLRLIKLGSLIEDDRRRRIRMARTALRFPEFSARAKAGARDDLEALAAGAVGDAPKRRERYDLDHYREVARVYTAAFSEGRKPLRAVAAHFQVPESTANKWIYVARHRHQLLDQTRPGVAAPASQSGEQA